MNRSAFLSQVLLSPEYSYAFVFLILLLALLCWKNLFIFRAALFVPLYYPIFVSLMTSSLLRYNSAIDNSTFLYIVISSLSYLLLLVAFFDNFLLPKVKEIFCSVSFLSSLKLLYICLSYMLLFSLLLYYSNSAFGDSVSRIHSIFASPLFRVLYPLFIIAKSVVLVLMAYFFSNGRVKPVLISFSVLFISSLLADSKGGFFIMIINALFIASSISSGFLGKIVANVRLTISNQRVLFRRIFIVFSTLASFIAAIVYAKLHGSPLLSLGFRFIMNSDAIFMYFPLHEFLSDKICLPLGPLAPLHRGIASFLGNRLAADPYTSFGVALQSFHYPSLLTLSGPNSIFPAWSHCYFGFVGGLGVLLFTVLFYCVVASFILKVKSDYTFKIICASILVNSLSYYQEISYLTSLSSYITIAFLLYFLPVTLLSR